MSDPLSMSSLPHEAQERIETLCDQFEAELRDARHPVIEEYLSRNASELRETLLAELLVLEMDYLLRAGARITEDAYRARFPDDIAIVDKAMEKALSYAFPHIKEGRSTAGSHRSDTAPDTLDAPTLSQHGPVARRCHVCGASIGECKPDGVLICNRCGEPAIDDNPASLPRLQSARRLGEYELERLVGVGGFGYVWRARDRRLGRTVAVKIPRENLSEDRELKRFMREARAAGRLRHPNIVPIHEVGRDGTTIFMVSDFIEGATLLECMTTAHFTPRAAVELLVTVAQAVHHAHEAGIVHRDIKPANILVDLDGRPFITDFGLARRMDDAATHFTAEGNILGTPAYMSPELASGNSRLADRRSDVYALGVVLFQLLTDDLPFRGTGRAILDRILHDPAPSPKSLNRDIARDLETICLKCLEKSPDQRYQSAAELADDLKRWLDHVPIWARRASPLERVTRWTRRKPTVAVLSLVTVVLFASVATVSALMVQRQRQSAEETRRAQREFRAGQSQQFLAKAELDKPMELTRNLPWLVQAFEADNKDEDRERIHRIRIGGTLARCAQLEGVGWHKKAVNHLDLSADGKFAASVDDDKTIIIWDAQTGKPKTWLAAPSVVQRLFFHSNGVDVVAVTIEGDIACWDVQSGSPKPLLGKHESHTYAVKVSLDRRFLVTGGADDVARVWSLDTHPPRSMKIKHPADVVDAQVDMDGHRLVTVAGDRRARLWDLFLGAEVPPGFRLKHPASRALISPSGRWVVTIDDHANAQLWDCQSQPDKPILLQMSSAATEAAFAPNDQLCMVLCQDGSCNSWSLGKEVSQGRTVTFGSKLERLSIASNSQVALATAGGKMVCLWETASGQFVAPPIAHPSAVRATVLSPDGELVVTACTDGGVRFWRLPDPNYRQLAHQAAIGACELSPNGRYLATGSHDHTAMVHDLAVPAANPVVLAHPLQVTAVAWSPDGARLATGDLKGQCHVWSLKPAPVLERTFMHAKAVQSIAWHPEGNRLASASEDHSLMVWDVGRSSLLATFPHSGYVRRLWYSPDGSGLFAIEDTSVMWWSSESATGPAERVFHHGNMVLATDTSPAGLLATAGGDGAVLVWDTKGGQPIAGPLSHAEAVWSICFDASGKRILTASSDGTSRLWSIGEDPSLAPVFDHGTPLRGARLSADETVLATLAGDGSVRVWDVSRRELVLPPMLGAETGQRAWLYATEGGFAAVLKYGQLIEVSTMPDSRPIERLWAISELTSGHRIDNDQILVPERISELSE